MRISARAGYNITMSAMNAKDRTGREALYMSDFLRDALILGVAPSTICVALPYFTDKNVCKGLDR
jgi:hypothetical protein